MSSAKITLLGFYNWMHDAGEDLFAAFDDLPAGVDKDDLVANILLRGGEFEVLYSDPVFMQQAITPWLHKWQRTIEKWITALSIQYDPLYNYDRTEEWTDKRVSTGSKESSLSHDESKAGGTHSDNEYETTGGTTERHSGSVVTENEVSAYDSGTYSPKDKSTATDNTGIGTTSNGRNTENLTGAYDEASKGSQTGKETSGSNDDAVHRGRMFGNIGVVSSQQMLTQELEVARFNLIDQITDLFLPEFIIPVYV